MSNSTILNANIKIEVKYNIIYYENSLMNAIKDLKIIALYFLVGKCILLKIL